MCYWDKDCVRTWKQKISLEPTVHCFLPFHYLKGCSAMHFISHTSNSESTMKTLIFFAIFSLSSVSAKLSVEQEDQIFRNYLVSVNYFAFKLVENISFVNSKSSEFHLVERTISNCERKFSSISSIK